MHCCPLSLAAYHVTQGLRGCRLGTVHPEITRMQVRAIMEAAVIVAKQGVRVHPHIMVPLVGIEDELTGQAKIVHEVAAQVFAAAGGWQCCCWHALARHARPCTLS
eukprot:GHRQ01025809.1.p4 GENE.GHRQ01025809.1~~GHRQ01025809.1.p4  ORF type:complete len:106 (-),score=31.13 GHRQ01025809.1:332-649(-)